MSKPMKIWKWLSEATPILNIIIVCTIFNMCMMVLFMYLSATEPSTPTTNCSSAHVKILADKLDEQGQLLAAYEFRYRGLHSLPEVVYQPHKP